LIKFLIFIKEIIMDCKLSQKLKDSIENIDNSYIEGRRILNNKFKDEKNYSIKDDQNFTYENIKSNFFSFLTNNRKFSSDYLSINFEI